MTRPRLDFVYPAVPDSVPAIRSAVADAAEELHADAATLAAVKLAVTEAVTNVVRHAYGDGSGEVRVAVEPGNRTLVVWVVDDGRGFEDRPHEREGGYGLQLMRELSRSCDVSQGRDGGTSIRMVFPLARGEQPL